MAFKYLIFRLNGTESISITHIGLQQGQGDDYQKDLCDEFIETIILFWLCRSFICKFTLTTLTYYKLIHYNEYSW